MKKLGDALYDSSDPCSGNVAKLVDDVPIAECLMLLGIAPFDSRDKDLKERFHHFSLDSVASLEFYGVPIEQSWWGTHYVDFIPGIKGISSSSCTFHAMSSYYMLYSDFYIYNSCSPAPIYNDNYIVAGR